MASPDNSRRCGWLISNRIPYGNRTCFDLGGPSLSMNLWVSILSFFDGWTNKVGPSRSEKQINSGNKKSRDVRSHCSLETHHAARSTPAVVVSSPVSSSKSRYTSRACKRSICFCISNHYRRFATLLKIVVVSMSAVCFIYRIFFSVGRQWMANWRDSALSSGCSLWPQRA